MSEITYNQYWDEIREIAAEIVSESMKACDNDRECAEEQINDYRLHEWIVAMQGREAVKKQMGDRDYFIAEYADYANGRNR